MAGHKIARRSALGLLAGAGTLVLAGCGVSGGGRYRFRMTVEVETPQGLRSGSAVYEVTAHRTLALTAQEHAGGGGTRGEAVVVDLPNGPMFVTLKMPVSGNDLGAVATLTLAPSTRRGDVDSFIDAVRTLGDARDGEVKAALPRADWPLMVRFGDISDPKTVEQVDPDTIGVKRILLETTSDDVTTGIEKRIPWIDHLDKYLADPSNPFTSTLPEDFGGFRNGTK
jgi:hypothetical protein